MIRSTMRAAVTEACLIGMTTFVGLAASAFEGVWKVKDTAGRDSVRRADLIIAFAVIAPIYDAMVFK